VLKCVFVLGVLQLVGALCAFRITGIHTWGSGRFSHVRKDSAYLTDYIVKELEEEIVETCLSRKK